MKINNIKLEDIPGASNLIRNVFDELIADEFPIDEVNRFHKLAGVNGIRERFLEGNPIFISKSYNQITGYIEVKNINHIYLLFVIKEFQNQGIAVKLINFTLNYLIENNRHLKDVTVNSTLSALKMYEKIGFKKIADYQMKDGIITYPMRLILNEFGNYPQPGI